jgi:hypothetical protein
VLLTRSPLYSRSCPRFLVRLACVRHAASVDSEPGSNSRLKPDRLPRRADAAVRPPRRTDSHFCEIARTETQTSQIQTGSPPSAERTVRSFNFSRLARSTCCQRPFHLTPERGDSVGGEPHGPRPRNLSRHTARRPVLQNLSTLSRIAASVNPRSQSLRSTNQNRHGGASTPILEGAHARKRSLRSAAVCQWARTDQAGGQKFSIKDRLEVLRLTRNPSGNSVPEYRPRGRSQFPTGLLYQMS